ncbi:MAG: arabinose isomerase [Armatimonadetes bacterium]|nr:arabinose isomerase [Armatimonadota bacterium]
MPPEPHHRQENARIGLLSVGHHTYWAQFPGLKDEIYGKLERLENTIQAQGVETQSFGLADDALTASVALARIRTSDIDLLMISMGTYATSAVFGALVRELAVPIVLVALQPAPAMDYARGTTYIQLLHDDFCAVPEFAGVAVRMGRQSPFAVLGYEDGDAQAQADLAAWCRVARALRDLKKARIGLMGHALDAMLDMHTDPTAVTGAFGSHVPLLEPHDLLRHFRRADREAIETKKRRILEFFDTPYPKADPLTRRLTASDLTVAARAAVALDGLIAEKKLTGLAYYYEGEEGSDLARMMAGLIVGNSLLTAGGFPMCGEYDLKTCIAMLIMDRLGMGGSFAEFHPVDFVQGTILVGHDGPHHIGIAQGKPVLRSLRAYHGKPGSGASVEFQIREGPVTILSIGVKADGAFKMVLAEGISERRPIPPTGNTNTHVRFGADIRRFLLGWVAEGPTHHFALGVGHGAEAIRRVAACLGVEAVVIRT